MHTTASAPSQRRHETEAAGPRRSSAALGAAMVAAAALAAVTPAQACWEQAAERYNVNPHLLVAIARCESSLDPAAVNRSHIERTGTVDIGLMQINSSNLRGLKPYGIGERELFDACTNIHVGAWILAQKIRQHGHTWEAVGAYNAACTQLKGQACSEARGRYARCVARHLPRDTAVASASEPTSERAQ
ncbi:MAG: lytic transglycosylase domain-containing protein [Aquabacterium sp.]|nr:lytic transglycosylase domain-containing protein [Aquabacterium sp.]